MVKPIMWLSFVLNLLITPYVTASSVMYTHVDKKSIEEGSHPTVNFEHTSNQAMGLDINCISPVPTIFLDQNGTATIDPNMFALPSTDPGCSPITLAVFLNGNPLSLVSCNDIPTMPNVEIRADDNCGNMASCNITLNIQDTLPPVMTCPNDTVLVTPSNQCFLNVALDSAAFDENCVFDSLYNSFENDNDIQADFPVGTTPITFYGEDIFNNVDSCTFTVTIRDFNDPVITCPAPPTSVFDCRHDVPLPFSTIEAFNNFGGTITDACDIDSLSWNVNETIDQSTCPITITRWYTVQDVNGNIDSCSHILQLNDEFSDLMVSPLADIEVDAIQGECHALVNFVDPTVNKSCGVTVSRYPSGNQFPVDTTEVVWTIAGSCRDTVRITQDVIVLDTENPSLTCETDKDIALTNSDNNALDKNSFIIATNDNCGVEFTGVHRMDGGCLPNDDTPDNEVQFCCSDVGSEVMVVVTARDHAGNTNSCMVSVQVNDNSAPIIVEGLPDITVSCEYFIDLNNLEEFGEIQLTEMDREPIDIIDPLYDGSGRDGLAGDNCASELLTLSYTFDDQRVNNQGKIFRYVEVVDTFGRSVIDDQMITITDVDPLTIADIMFPNDTSIVGPCNANLEPEVTGEPIIMNDDICTMPAFEKEDLVFDHPNEGCKMIKRTWTVIDMAQFIPNTNTGRWTGVQYITLHNNSAPVILSGCRDTTFCASAAECESVKSLHIVAMDSCIAAEDLLYRYEVDLNKDGTIDYSGDNDSLSVLFPAGSHEVHWEVEDRCGNIMRCSQNVSMRECKAPTPICHNGLSVDLNNLLEAEMWASDFNNHSYDNCTPKNDLIYSFSEDVTDQQIVLDCDDKGDKILKIYVTDLFGNQSFCVTHVLVTDNINPCPKDANEIFRVGGIVATEEDVTIANAAIEITDGSMSKKVMSNNFGEYMFYEIEGANSYQIQASKNNECLEGISTLDLVLIQRHILELEKLNSPYKLIAADVNGSNSITSSDLVELRKLILGVQEKLAHTECWKFLDQNYIFDDKSNPWNYPEDAHLADLSVDELSSDLVAIKIGDVNGSVSNIHDPNSSTRSANIFQVLSEDVLFEEGEEIRIPVVAQSAIDMVALQANFSFDTDALEFVGIESKTLDLKPSFHHLDKTEEVSNLSIAYSNVHETSISKEDDLFVLKFIAKSSNKLSNVFTENSSRLQSVAFDEQYQMHYIQYDFDVEYLKPLTLGTATPNPFVDATNFKLFVAYKMPLEITLVDPSGRQIYRSYEEYLPGVHYIEIGEDKLKDVNGVFYFNLSGAEISESRKLIRIR